MTSYLADIDSRGHLITCGAPAALAVIACIVGALVLALAWVSVVMRAASRHDQLDFVPAFVLGFGAALLGAGVITVGAFYLAAYLTQGSCS